MTSSMIEAHPRRVRRIAAVVPFLILAALVILLGLQWVGLSSFPGLVLIAYPGLALWDLGYRGPLIAWGDGWAWLTPAGIAAVYGPILVALSWLCYRLGWGHGSHQHEA